MLKRQIMDESEQINETLKENSYVCHKYGIDISVPGEIDNDSADLLVHAVERMANAANDKYGTKSDSLSRSTETRSSIQQKVSEKTALQRYNERNLSNLRDQMNALEDSARGVNAIKLAIGEIKDFEITNGFGSTITDSVMPQDLIQHLTKRISESSAETDSPESIARTMKKLMKMSRATNADGVSSMAVCLSSASSSVMTLSFYFVDFVLLVYLFSGKVYISWDFKPPIFPLHSNPMG